MAATAPTSCGRSPGLTRRRSATPTAGCERIERRDITALDQVPDQEENRAEDPPEDDDEG
ncbi:MAG: hypothetical protein ICV69_04205 [Thermoleophilaceae bacterium]|nr:hypothetical protein [Thermoleophilaceae bacterium]